MTLNIRVAEWKKPPVRSVATPSKSFSWGCGIVLVLACTLILALSKWALVAIEADPDGPVGRFIGFGLIGFLVLPMFGLLLYLNLATRRAPMEEPEHPPAQLPRTAVRCLVRLKTANDTYAVSMGWLWVDREWLVFDGESFDFRLRRSDFKVKGDLIKKVKAFESIPLVLPPKSPVRTLSLLPTSTREGRPVLSREQTQQLGKNLEPWEQASSSKEASLYPPVLYPLGLASWAPWFLGWLPAALITGAVCAACLLSVNSYVVNPLATPGLVGFLAGFGLIFTMGLIEPAHEWDGRRSNKALWTSFADTGIDLPAEDVQFEREATDEV